MYSGFYVFAVEFSGDYTCCSGTHKWVEDDSIFRASGQNAVSHQFFGERRKMRFLQGLCRNYPYVSFVPKFPIDICVAAFCPVKLFGVAVYLLPP